ncbi:HAMP domain-containing histidine kinase [Prolixibacteraceae bacterium JC049]|nr:HAMP domain-containing histidine kinase [Prolixibacteraceae bacterium JC049]
MYSNFLNIQKSKNFKQMKRTLLFHAKYLIPAIVLLLIAMTLESNWMEQFHQDGMVERFQKRVLKQEKVVRSEMDEITHLLTKQEPENLFTTLSRFNDILSERGHAYMIYKHDSLSYWSDNEITYRNNRLSNRRGLVRLPNGFYYKWIRRANDFTICAYLQIKWVFPYRNKYLQPHFSSKMELPNDFQISRQRNKEFIHINNAEGKFMFSVQRRHLKHDHDCTMRFSCLLLLFSFIAFLIGFKSIIRRVKVISSLHKIVITFLFFTGMYLFFVMTDEPAIFFNHQLFSPRYFAYSDWLPSLGHFLIISMFWIVWSYIFYKEFRFLPSLSESKKSNLHSIIWQAINGTAVVFIAYLQFILFSNSSVSFEFYNIIDLSIYSIIGILSVLCLFAGYFFVTIQVYKAQKKHLSRKTYFTQAGITAVIVVLACWGLGIIQPVVWGIFLFLFNTLFYFTNRLQFSQYRLSVVVLYTFTTSILFLIFMQENLEKREREVMKILALNLASEHDPTAEVLLQQISNGLKNDSVVGMMLESRNTPVDWYLFRNYFNGFWRKYDLQTTICNELDSVVVQPDNEKHSCYPFFDEMILKQGMPIQNTQFHFMDRMNGRISYIGKFCYPSENRQDSTTLFIELVSKIQAEGIGFPELLLDEKATPSKNMKKYSSAKYFNKELVDRSGDVTYDLTADAYMELMNEEGKFEWEGSEHFAYRYGEKGDNLVVVSKRRLFLSEYLISFPYVFLSFFLLATVIAMFYRKRRDSRMIRKELKIKVQTSIILVVVTSLLIVGSGTIFYTYKAYQSKHESDLSDRIQSVLTELETWLSGEEKLDIAMQEYLTGELARLSDVFRTDINMYSLDGKLLASSRPQIFKTGLVSPQMNAKAFVEMTSNRKRKFIHPEQIGSLSYLSAYVPLVNNQSKYLGYINLPYFTRQDTLQQEISTFIVAFINIYVFLLLGSIIVAVFVSNQITKPLALIREKLRSIQLGKKNESINYLGEDEIGSLVKEYNQKVEELQHSATLLARSEREMAWREMAKQIAHEIKNPLTPMKLNIQYLIRAHEENVEDFDHYLNKVTKVLIEQIDKLTAIATAFSNFATIPKANMQHFQIMETLRQAVTLFDANEKAHFKWEINTDEELWSYSDPDQISRVFINLIKNAMQAIPNERDGKIILQIRSDKQWILISVIDNGIGIDEATKEKLFVPNFTTKSSGTGLGLAISKNIIENFGGYIWCENNPTEGARFIIKLPKHKK